MKRKRGVKTLTVFLLFALCGLLFTFIRMPAFADYEDGVECEYCGAYRYDDWLCDGGDHCSENADGDCYMYHHCRECGACEDSTEFCEEHLMCVDCAVQNGEEHCMNCRVCCLETDFCDEHGLCVDCELGPMSYRCPECEEHYAESDWECCEECRKCFDCGGECSVQCLDKCLECHLNDNEACEICGKCFRTDDDLQCSECGKCYDCGNGRCEFCEMCMDCAEDMGNHCPNCGDCLESGDVMVCVAGACGGMCENCADGFAKTVKDANHVRN
jgi:hypothetical protein